MPAPASSKVVIPHRHGAPACMKNPVLLCCSVLALLAGACSRVPEAPAVVAAVPAAAQAQAAPDPAYLAGVEQWRRDRARELRDPDGWLSFAGSGPVDAGSQAVGSAADNAIVVPGGPAHWGTLELGGNGRLRFHAAPAAGLLIDGKPFATAVLRTQLEAHGPTRVQAGELGFYVVRTGEVYGWRLRDPHAAALQAFKGVPHFPVDPSWRIQAQWEPFAEPRTVELVTSNGTFAPAQVPGQASFERGGRRYTLLPVTEEGEDTLFFIIADRTSGKQTYGGGRFLYAPAPHDGIVELDFNKAQNPPCALNGHVVCPTAPPENRLDLRITAGEKTYPLPH